MGQKEYLPDPSQRGGEAAQRGKVQEMVGVENKGGEFRSNATTTSLLLPFESSSSGLLAYDSN